MNKKYNHQEQGQKLFLLFSCSVTQSCLTLVTLWTAARQASLSFTISWSLLKLMSIESMMPSNDLILCHLLLLLPSIFPSIRIFSNELVPPIKWQKYQSFSFSISIIQNTSLYKLNQLYSLNQIYIPVISVVESKRDFIQICNAREYYYIKRWN